MTTPDSPLQLLKDPYLYVIGLFAGLSVQILLNTQEKSATWYLGLALLLFSSILLLIRFAVSMYRDHFEGLFSKHYDSVIDKQAQLLEDTRSILATQSSTDKMAHEVAQKQMSRTLAVSDYEIDRPAQETRDS